MTTDAFYSSTVRSLLAPILPLLDDPSISEIMINGPSRIFAERDGLIFRTEARFDSREAILAALRSVAQYGGGFLDEAHPILHSRLPDGSRLEAVIAPVAESGPHVAIRRHTKPRLNLDQLIDLQALSEDAAQALVSMVRAKCNLVILGANGSGKTTLLNVLARTVPSSERIVLLEASRELDLPQDHVLRFKTASSTSPGRGAVSTREILRASLRMRPDRIVLDDLCGDAALDFVQATTSGYGGCLAALGATSPQEALARLEAMAMAGERPLPLHAVRTQVAAGIDLLIHVARLPNGRRGVMRIAELTGLDDPLRHYQLRDLFRRTKPQLDSAGHLQSELRPTGILPSCLPQLTACGERLPQTMLEVARA